MQAIDFREREAVHQPLRNHCERPTSLFFGGLKNETNRSIETTLSPEQLRRASLRDSMSCSIFGGDAAV